jgi:hypothetical protein
MYLPLLGFFLPHAARSSFRLSHAGHFLDITAGSVYFLLCDRTQRNLISRLSYHSQFRRVVMILEPKACDNLLVDAELLTENDTLTNTRTGRARLY